MMPSVDYIYAQVRSGTLSGSDCVELFGESTETLGQAHPPHPHAHIAKDGFVFGETSDLAQLRQELIYLRMKLNTKYGTRPPAYETWKKDFPKVQQKILALEARQGLNNKEGTHIDRATLQAMIPAKYRLDQPPLPDYSQRANPHSQFEDSEAAIMALFYSLNCKAGLDALYELTHGWFFSSSWDRFVLHSLTAVKGLQNGPIQPEPVDGGAPSAHPSRNRDFRVVERGAGAAGAAPTPKSAIGRVSTVLARVGASQLRVVTHYPVVAWTPPPAHAAELNTHDFVQFVSFARNERIWKTYRSDAAAAMTW
jgi:hypothetical protein